MKTLLVLLLFMPTILFAKNQIIYCYDIDKFSDIAQSDVINYYEIDDKNKKLIDFKQYFDGLRGSEFYHLGDEDWSLNDFDDSDKTIEIFKFDKNHISFKLIYPDINFRTDKIEKYVRFVELDRIAGLMILKSGISIDDNGDMFAYKDYNEGEKFYLKEDSSKFWAKVYTHKYKCEKNKEL